MPKKYLAAAVLILLIAAWRTVGYHQGDEHFQILEFAGYKLGWVAAEQLPWEFHERMRPALQPLIAYWLTRAVGWFGPPDPFFIAFVLRLLSAGLFLGVMVALYRRYAPSFPAGPALRWFALLSLFTWCCVYSGVRFSSENWSGAFFALGFLVYPRRPAAGQLALARVRGVGEGSQALLAGVLFGLSFECRYQLALAVVGFVTWLLFATKVNYKFLALLFLGGLLSVGLGTVADRWLYGDWVFAPWNYLAQNLLEGKAAGFGSEPFYAYVPFILVRGIPPLSVVYLAAIGYFCYRYRSSPLTWSFAAFFVVHCLLARKDIRFLFPLLPFLPLVVAVAYRDLLDRFGADYLRTGWRKRVAKLLIVVNCALLVGVAVRPLGSHLAVMRYVYDHYEGPITLLADGRHFYNHSDLVIDWYQSRAGVRIVPLAQRGTQDCGGSQTCLYSIYTKTPSVVFSRDMRLVYTTNPAPSIVSGTRGAPNSFSEVLGIRYWYLFEVAN